MQYLKEVSLELKKVTWPTRGTVLRYSLGVIVSAAIVAACFALIDMATLEGLKMILGAKF